MFKSYHIYLSNDLSHDQTFVETVIRNMLDEVDIQPGRKIVIKSDNCCYQYKSAQNFYDLQLISNDYTGQQIRTFYW